VAHRASTAVSPTLNFLLNGTTIYSLTVSASTTPQVVQVSQVPFFNAITVSMSTPASLTTTNAVSATVIENALTIQ
jgi:hypothetical protein